MTGWIDHRPNDNGFAPLCGCLIDQIRLKLKSIFVYLESSQGSASFFYRLISDRQHLSLESSHRVLQRNASRDLNPRMSNRYSLYLGSPACVQCHLWGP